jgi:hypothetical protein
LGCQEDINIPCSCYWGIVSVNNFFSVLQVLCHNTYLVVLRTSNSNSNDMGAQSGAGRCRLHQSQTPTRRCRAYKEGRHGCVACACVQRRVCGEKEEALPPSLHQPLPRLPRSLSLPLLLCPPPFLAPSWVLSLSLPTPLVSPLSYFLSPLLRGGATCLVLRRPFRVTFEPGLSESCR